MYKNTKAQGNAGFGIAIGWFASKGYTVSVPLTDSQFYDLVVEYAFDFKTVQVKTTTYKKHNNFVVQLCTKGGNKTSTGRTKPFNPTAVHWLFIITADNDFYLIPSILIESVTTLTLGSKWNEFRVQAAKLESRTSL